MTQNAIDPNDCIVLFADLQVGIVELTQTVPLDRLRTGVKGLAQLAKIFGMPIVVSAIAGDDGSPASILPEIEDNYGSYTTHHRTTANSLLNTDILQVIRASGRHTILISGVATELAVQLPALSAPELGYRAVVVMDACGGVSARTETAALTRITQAGSTTSCVMTLAGELAGDFRQPLAQQAIGVIFEMAS